MRNLSRSSRRFSPLANTLEQRAAVSTLIAGFDQDFSNPTLQTPTHRTSPHPAQAVNLRPSEIAVPTIGTDAGATLAKPTVLPNKVKTNLISGMARHTSISPAIALPAMPNTSPIRVSPSIAPQARPTFSPPSPGGSVPAPLTPPTSSSTATPPQSTIGQPAAPVMASASQPPAPPQPTQTTRSASPMTAGGPTIALLTDLGESIPDGDNSAYNVVGDMAEAIVVAPQTIQSVTWKIEGAISVQNYTYTQASGSFQALDNPTTTQNVNSTISGYEFYWNGTAGNHTVSATVTYTDGSSADTNVMNVNVQSPTVDSFVDQYNTPSFVSWTDGNNNTMIGPADGLTGNPGQSFTALVDTAEYPQNHGGSFYFLQLVNTTRTLTDPDGDQIQKITSNGKYVLDAPGGPNAASQPPNYFGYESADNPAGLTNIMIPESPYGPGFISDTPAYGENVGNYPNAYAKTISINDQFKMYLMYQSDDLAGSIAIALSEIQWSFNVTATYNGPANGVAADYTNGQNWTMNVTSPQANPAGNVINGTAPDTPIPTWDGNSGSLMPA